MRLVLRAFVDPALERGDFFGREATDLRLGRGHDFLLVGAFDAEHQFALGAVAGDDHRGAIFDAEGAFLRVEAQLRLAALFIGAVAMVTLVRKDRAHLAAEIDGRQGRRRRSGASRSG